MQGCVAVYRRFSINDKMETQNWNAKWFFFPHFRTSYFCFIDWRRQTIRSIDWENDKVIRLRILPILSFTFRQITHLPHSLTFTLQAFNQEMAYSNIDKSFPSNQWFFFFSHIHSHSISWMTKLNQFDTELPIIIIIRIILNNGIHL